MSNEAVQSFDDYMAARARLVESYLDSTVPSEDTPPATLSRAVRYSLFAGGKRLRPILVLASAEACVAVTFRAPYPRPRRSR